MNIGTAGGKIFLLYKHAEEGNIRKMRKQLASEGIIAVPCEDPANFKFVTPAPITATPAELDVIGRAALNSVGLWDAKEKFINELKRELGAPTEVKDRTAAYREESRDRAKD